MEGSQVLLLLVIVSILSITATNLFYSLYVVDNVIEKEMSLIIGNRTGFDMSTEKITFGMITKKGSCRRDIFLSNNKDYPIEIKVSKNGNISPFVLISDNKFVLNPGEEKKVSFTASSYPEAEYGSYNGKARFVFKRKI
jgi:hypothetical protein